MLKSIFHRASLINKLPNIISESDQGGKLPEAEIKALVSGETITIVHKFVLEPLATLFWATNHLLYSHHYSDAINYSVNIVEFNHKFEGQDNKLNLRNKLREEMSGILNTAPDAYATIMKMTVKNHRA